MTRTGPSGSTHKVLGLEVNDQRPLHGRGERWLSVVSPEDPDGVQLVLHLTDEPARAFRAASQAGPAGDLADHRRLRRRGRTAEAKGVVFVKEPDRMEYGGMDAVFDDTCGNLINFPPKDDSGANGDGTSARPGGHRWARS